MVGSLVRGVLVHGLELIEHAFPMPARLGVPLIPGRGARHDADPIVLVSGFANSPMGWDEWRRSLVADGFDVHVFDMPSRGLGDMRESARLLAEYIEQVRRRTGRRTVDIIGFSEGGLLARMVAGMHGGAHFIDRLISLASPHAGIGIAAKLYHRRTFLSDIVDDITTALGQLFEGSALLGAIERADAPLRAARAGGTAFLDRQGGLTGCEEGRPRHVVREGLSRLERHRQIRLGGRRGCGDHQGGRECHQGGGECARHVHEPITS